MFKNLTVAKRLALGFGATVALGVAIAGYAAVTMGVLSAGIDELSTNRMVKVAQFNELKSNLQDIGRFARNIIINTDPAFAEAEKKKIAELRARNGEILDRLAKTSVLPKGVELLKIINDNRGPYNAKVDHAIELALKGDRAAGGTYLISEVRPLQALVFKAVGDTY